MVCAYCSANRAPLKYRGYEASRVCDQCFQELYKCELPLVIFPNTAFFKKKRNI